MSRIIRGNVVVEEGFRNCERCGDTIGALAHECVL